MSLDTDLQSLEFTKRLVRVANWNRNMPGAKVETRMRHAIAELRAIVSDFEEGGHEILRAANGRTLVGIGEVRRLLGVTERTAQRWSDVGYIPVVARTFGRQRRYDMAEIKRITRGRP